MEILAPAGSPEAVRAAVCAGTNAVYLGFGNFNARRNAKNFTREELAQAISYCHLRGVKLYLTLNTLISDREMEQAAQDAVLASELGIDAVLVQDLGMVRVLRQVAPGPCLHPDVHPQSGRGEGGGGPGDQPGGGRPGAVPGGPGLPVRPLPH